MDQSSTIAKGKPIPSNWVWEKFTPMFIGGAPKRPVNVYGAKTAPKPTPKRPVNVYGAKTAVSKSEYAKIWKDAGCTTKSRYSDWVKKQTKTTLIKDSKIWATSNKEHHKKGCYGNKKTASKRPVPKRPAHKSAVLKKITYKSKKDIPINTNNVIRGDIDISHVPDIVDTDIKLKFTYPDKSMGKTNNLKSPNMSMKVDMKDTTKFELFGSEKNTNNISNILAIFLLIIFLIILYFQKN
jgi:hypothetical protein